MSQTLRRTISPNTVLLFELGWDILLYESLQTKFYLKLTIFFRFWLKILTKNWKIPVNWPFYHPFCPPMAYFRWILAYIDVLCQLFTFNIQKIDFWVQKGKNFEMLKIFNQAHVWGSSALIMLPHVLGGVCEQRGDPDDDFEYWMASLPRRGAEIWPDKVFWSKNQKFKKMHFYHLRPSWCIKMVLLGTNSSYVKAYIAVGHFWGIWQEKKSFWANK